MKFLVIVTSVIADWRQQHSLANECTPIPDNLTL